MSKEKGKIQQLVAAILPDVQQELRQKKIIVEDKLIELNTKQIWRNYQKKDTEISIIKSFFIEKVSLFTEVQLIKPIIFSFIADMLAQSEEQLTEVETDYLFTKVYKKLLTDIKKESFQLNITPAEYLKKRCLTFVEKRSKDPEKTKKLKLKDATDHKVWQELESDYKNLVIRTLIKSGRQVADAQDAWDEAKSVLWQELQKEGAYINGKIKNYLMKVAKNYLNQPNPISSIDWTDSENINKQDKDVNEINCSTDQITEKALKEQQINAMTTCLDDLEKAGIITLQRKIENAKNLVKKLANHNRINLTTKKQLEEIYTLFCKKRHIYEMTKIEIVDLLKLLETILNKPNVDKKEDTKTIDQLHRIAKYLPKYHVVEASIFKKKSHQSIASKFGITETNSKKMLYDAIQKLKNCAKKKQDLKLKKYEYELF